jgi:hypothetical protein
MLIQSIWAAQIQTVSKTDKAVAKQVKVKLTQIVADVGFVVDKVTLGWLFSEF